MGNVDIGDLSTNYTLKLNGIEIAASGQGVAELNTLTGALTISTTTPTDISVYTGASTIYVDYIGTGGGTGGVTSISGLAGQIGLSSGPGINIIANTTTSEISISNTGVLTICGDLSGNVGFLAGSGISIGLSNTTDLLITNAGVTTLCGLTGAVGLSAGPGISITNDGTNLTISNIATGGDASNWASNPAVSNVNLSGYVIEDLCTGTVSLSGNVQVYGTLQTASSITTGGNIVVTTGNIVASTGYISASSATVQYLTASNATFDMINDIISFKLGYIVEFGELSVSSGALANINTITFNSSYAGDENFYILRNGSNPAQYSFKIDNSDNKCYAIGFNSTSDRRLKTNIHELQYGLRDINELHPVEFTWDPSYNSYQGVQLGLLAQEVEQIIPTVVSTDEKTDMKSLNYSGLIPVLVKAIQELTLRVNELETTLYSKK